MKITHGGESACFIATLNTTDSALPSAVLNASATVTNSNDDGDNGNDSLNEFRKINYFSSSYNNNIIIQKFITRT